MRPLLILPLLLLAGCAGLGGTPEEGNADDAVAQAREDMEHALEEMEEDAGMPRDASEEPDRASVQASGNGTAPEPRPQDASATPANATAPPAPPVPPPPTTVSVAFDGKLGTGAVRCERNGNATSCVQAVDDPASYDPEIGDALVSFELTMTWEATTPFSDQLVLAVETCDHASCEAVEVAGPSPLSLDVPDAKLRGRPYVTVRPVDATDGIRLEEGTPFRIEGYFVTVVLPGGEGFAGRSG